MVKAYQLRTGKDGKLELRQRFANRKHKGRCNGAFGGGKSLREMITSHIPEVGVK